MEIINLTSFKTAKAFNNWLFKNHNKKTELWIRIYKKDSKIKTMTYHESIEEALCFGWIDGIRKSYDEVSFVQRFTPRRKNSIWSKRNTKIIEKLISENRIQDSGLQQVQLAKENGMWDKAY